MADLFEILSQAVQKGDQKAVVQAVRDGIKQGVSANDILDKGLVPGIQLLSKLFQSGEVFLPEILIAARAMNAGVAELQPYFTNTSALKKGTVVLGTVEGDLHDIGKNLVRIMLDCNGFNVIDLGVDVSAESFVNAAREHKADIVAMSALLTITMTHMPTVIEALEQADIRKKVNVMIGGAPITRAYADEIGAEGFAVDCTLAVDEAMRLLATKKEGF